jgi:hypothetical protein
MNHESDVLIFTFFFKYGELTGFVGDPTDLRSENKAF